MDGLLLKLSSSTAAAGVGKHDSDRSADNKHLNFSITSILSQAEEAMKERKLEEAKARPRQEPVVTDSNDNHDDTDEEEDDGEEEEVKAVGDDDEGDVERRRHLHLPDETSPPIKIPAPLRPNHIPPCILPGILPPPGGSPYPPVMPPPGALTAGPLDSYAAAALLCRSSSAAAFTLAGGAGGFLPLPGNVLAARLGGKDKASAVA